ncbi:Glycosyl transferases group 1 [compost metagenome]
MSNVSGYDEYIVDGYNALVVEMGDINGARDAVNKLIEDKELRDTLILNGKKTVQNWKWDPSINILEKILLGNVHEGGLTE